MISQLMKLSLTEIINLHLQGPRVPFGRLVGSIAVCSSLTEIVAESTNAAAKKYSSPLLPLMGYLSALDQIGNCYGVTEKNTTFKNGIKRALTLFAGLSRPEIDVLYALRNGVVHNCSLISIGDKSKGGTSVAFYLKDTVIRRQQLTPPAILKMPAASWDGEITSLTTDHYAGISLEGVENLTTNVVNRAIEAFQQGILVPNHDHFPIASDEEIKQFIIVKYLLLTPK